MLKENQLQAAKIGPLEGKIQTGAEVKEEIQKNQTLTLLFIRFWAVKRVKLKPGPW